MSKAIGFLAEQLKARRKALGLSQEEFAEKTGVSMALISEIERGKANPTVITLEKISGFLNTRLAELLDAEGVIDDTENLKKIFMENIEQMSSKQLKIILSIIRMLAK